jgi:hypothetical protein
MKVIILLNSYILLSICGFQERPLEGKWKLVQFDPFELLLISNDYRLSDEETREEMDRIIQFTLENTIYEFKSDTVFMTDYKNDSIITRKGIFFIEDDKITINYYDIIGSTHFRLIKVSENELVLELVYREIPNNLHARFIKLKE